MKTILEEIVNNKLMEIAQLKQSVLISDYLQNPNFDGPVRSLKKQLHHFGIIAEIKRKSPSAGEISPGLDVADQARLYESQGAAGISVLTDFRYFGGSIEDLIRIRENTQLPILRKEFILDEYQLFESKAAGADAILLIASILEKEQAHHLTILAKSMGLEVIFEIHSFEELAKINEEIDILLVNYRNLRSQVTDVENSIRLAPYLPDNIPIISASGITQKSELAQLQQHGFHGALIGESILKGTSLSELTPNPVQL